MIPSDKLIERAEALVKQRAARHAYMKSEKVMANSDAQKLVYGLIRESIMLGARLMQEAINELTPPKK